MYISCPNEECKFHEELPIHLIDEDIYAHFYIGNVLKEIGEYDGAKEEFEKVLSISPAR